LDVSGFEFAFGLKDFKTKRMVENVKFAGAVIAGNKSVKEIGSHECNDFTGNQDTLYCLDRSEISLFGADL